MLKVIKSYGNNSTGLDNEIYICTTIVKRSVRINNFEKLGSKTLMIERNWNIKFIGSSTKFQISPSAI